MLKKISAFLFLAFALSLLFLGQARAEVTISDPTKGLDETVKSVPAFQSQTKGTYDSSFLTTRAGSIISLVLSFVGVLFLILMIYAGIMWMIASGNDQQISKAKSLMINAIIGIVIVLSAYAITSFIGTSIITQ